MRDSIQRYESADIKDTSLYLLWSSAKEIAEASVDDSPSGGGDDDLSGGGDDDPSGGGDEDLSGGGDVVSQVEELMIPQVEEMMVPQVEKVMVPQMHGERQEELPTDDQNDKWRELREAEEDEKKSKKKSKKGVEKRKDKKRDEKWKGKKEMRKAKVVTRRIWLVRLVKSGKEKRGREKKKSDVEIRPLRDQTALVLVAPEYEADVTLGFLQDYAHTRASE
ncbi:hypothetical protein EMCRGX_G012216 [Ephydatia muelleri]